MLCAIDAGAIEMAKYNVGYFVDLFQSDVAHIFKYVKEKGRH